MISHDLDAGISTGADGSVDELHSNGSCDVLIVPLALEFAGPNGRDKARLRSRYGRAGVPVRELVLFTL